MAATRTAGSRESTVLRLRHLLLSDRRDLDVIGQRLHQCEPVHRRPEVTSHVAPHSRARRRTRAGPQIAIFGCTSVNGSDQKQRRPRIDGLLGARTRSWPARGSARGPSWTGHSAPVAGARLSVASAAAATRMDASILPISAQVMAPSYGCSPAQSHDVLREIESRPAAGAPTRGEGGAFGAREVVDSDGVSIADLDHLFVRPVAHVEPAAAVGGLGAQRGAGFVVGALDGYVVGSERAFCRERPQAGLSSPLPSGMCGHHTRARCCGGGCCCCGRRCAARRRCCASRTASPTCTIRGALSLQRTARRRSTAAAAAAAAAAAPCEGSGVRGARRQHRRAVGTPRGSAGWRPLVREGLAHPSAD